MHKFENFCNLKMKIVFFIPRFSCKISIIEKNKKSDVVSHFLKLKKKFFCKLVNTRSISRFFSYKKCKIFTEGRQTFFGEHLHKKTLHPIQKLPTQKTRSKKSVKRTVTMGDQKICRFGRNQLKAQFHSKPGSFFYFIVAQFHLKTDK